MIPELRTGIQTLGQTVTGLSASNFRYGQQRRTQSGQHCFYFGVDNTFEFDSVDGLDRVNVQFTFWGAKLSSLETLVENFKAVFDFTDSLSVEDYNVLEVRRNLSVPAQRFTTGTKTTWQIIMEYQFIINKTR
jgi:hypothetical protein